MEFDLKTEFRFDGWKKLPEELREAIREKTIDQTLELYHKVQANVDGAILARRSGELFNSINISSRQEGNDYIGKVYVDPATPKAFALEFGGTKNYVIAASSKLNLMFFWEREERWFIGPMVNHPPSKEFAYLRNALDNVNLAAGYTEVVDRAIRQSFQ